ncbi:MAG: alpha-glucan family phosphorylase [Desulfatibacillaceae bacterium]
MGTFQTFQVFPAIPESLSFVEELSRNLWWSWQHDAKELFRRVNPGLWEKSGENPIAFSTMVSRGRLEELARDESFLAHQKRVRENFERLVQAPIDRTGSPWGDGTVAYFSMEFGIHESLPLVAGGLGVLAGDHLKAASDLGTPLVGVGLMYRQGYFRQFLTQDGWQQEEYPETDLYHMPIERVRDASGHEVMVSVTGPDGEIKAAVWKIQVGRVPLFLLDTNISENPASVRDITNRLYAGDSRRRLAQEIVLGIGGLRAIEAAGVHPKVLHMNEGHSAFVGLERLIQCMKTHGVDLKAALEIVPRCSVFTTHTPVPAGHDEFPAEMVRPYIAPLTEAIGASEDEILSWGQPVGTEPHGPLSMFVLALRMAQYCNGVSRLHGRVARRMWSHVWPHVPEHEIPIGHITNGVHPTTWLSPENTLIYDRYLGPEWYNRCSDAAVVDRIDTVYDEELWRAHEVNRSRLIRNCRDMMVRQYGRRNAPSSAMQDAATVLDQDVLTIGFARRFATYKRAHLLFQDVERLEALINNRTQPLQIIFAGKAHPKDNEGKDLIKYIVETARRQGLRHRVVFLENYDMRLARYLVQGCDIWLNTPRRPMEACGTSGMKAALNGVLNVSILDGWWDEGYNGKNGWAIGGRGEYHDHTYQDAIEGQALYNLLENDVIPTFYDRKNGDVPSRWVGMMKASMKTALLDFSSQRMVEEYEKRFYLPAVRQSNDMLDDDGKRVKALVGQHARLKRHWKEIEIGQPERDRSGAFRVGEEFTVTSEVRLGDFSPDEVVVELYYGQLHSIDALSVGEAKIMEVQEKLGPGHYIYSCRIECEQAGRFGFTARAKPAGDYFLRNRPGLITWA